MELFSELLELLSGLPLSLAELKKLQNVIAHNIK